MKHCAVEWESISGGAAEWDQSWTECAHAYHVDRGFFREVRQRRIFISGLLQPVCEISFGKLVTKYHSLSIWYSLANISFNAARSESLKILRARPKLRYPHYS